VQLISRHSGKTRLELILWFLPKVAALLASATHSGFEQTAQKALEPAVIYLFDYFLLAHVQHLGRF
jgi:hypothetical protein